MKWLWLISAVLYAQVPPTKTVDLRRPDAPASGAKQPRVRAVTGPTVVEDSTTPVDPFKTGQTDTASPVQGIVRAAKSGLAIADMLCEIVEWSHATRTVTCGLEGNQTSYSGVLIVHFTDRTVWSRTVFVEQPINNGKMETWGVAVIPVYGDKSIASVEFGNGGPLASWDQTPAARGTLDGTYNYPTPQATYPVPVRVSEMLCHISEFLIGKSQAQINPVYSATCVLAGNIPFYGGNVSVWWHEFESRLTPSSVPVPAAQSLAYTANFSRYVMVQHDVINNVLQYWGPAAFLVTLETRRAFDRINFYPEREEITWPSSTTYTYPTPPPMNAFQKVYFRNRYCTPESCMRPPG